MKTTVNNINIVYPDLGFAFNPIRVFVDNLKEDNSVTLEVGSIKITREVAPTSKSISFDLSALAKSLFDRLDFNLIEEQDTTLLKKIDFKLYNNDFSLTGTIPVLWGALQIGERYTQNKTLTYFKGYPFTLPLYLEKKILLEAINERDEIFPFSFVGPGKLNLDISKVEAFKSIKIMSVGSSMYAIFDYTFDSSFGPERVTTSNVIDLDINIKVADCTPDGVYLRWINKYGEYNYYLFNSSNQTSKTKNSDIKYDNVYFTTDLSNNYHHGTGKNIGKEIEQSMKLFAHLVDAETVDFLQHLVESPVVDMFLGYDENNSAKWVSVDIQDGTFAKSTAVLQDFEFFLIPNNKLVQTL